MNNLVPENLLKVKRFHVLLCSCSCSCPCSCIDLGLPDRLADRLTGGMITPTTLGGKGVIIIVFNLLVCNNSFIRMS